MSTALYLWVFEGEDHRDGGAFEVVTSIEPGKKLGSSKASEWVVEGSAISGNYKGVALADSSYARQKDIEVGDSIETASKDQGSQDSSRFGPTPQSGYPAVGNGQFDASAQGSGGNSNNLFFYGMLWILAQLIIRRYRAIVNCLGIAVAVALVISLFSISEAYRLAVRAPFEESGVDLVVQLPKDQSGSVARTKGVILPDSATPISQKEVEELSKVPGISGMATSIQVWSFDVGRFKVIEGVDPGNQDIGPVGFRQ